MNSIYKKSLLKLIIQNSKPVGVFFSIALMITAFLDGNATGEPGADPYSLGMGNARIVYGGGNNAAVLNPAVLGAQIEPWGGMQLIPLSSYAAGYWSDKLALTPYREFFSIDKDGQWQKIVTQILNETFKVAGDTPEETSRKITKKIDGGTSVYSDEGVSLLELTLGRVAVDVRTSVDAKVDLPDAPFLILFSDDNGLKKGSDFSFKHLGAQARVCTDISLGYGEPADLSQIADFLNDLTRGFTDFKYASWGLGMTVSLGHGYLDLTTKKGGVHYSDDGSKITMDVDAKLKTAGTGLRDNYQFGNPYEDGFSLAGWGAGINAGMLLYGEHSSVSVAIRRLGPMIWNNIQEGDVHVQTQDLTVADLLEQKVMDLFVRSKGGDLPDEHDSLHNGSNQFGWQPTRFNLGMGYRFNFRQNDKQAIRALTEFINTSMEYEQSLARWPGRSFVPRLALGAENGFLWGVLPFRVGFVFGGAEKIASTAGFSLGLRAFCLQAAYEAIGTPYWYPKRGFEVAVGLSTEWKRYRDPDQDGISDKTDRCPYEKEDMDGYEDKDGCPDYNNDKDAIADSLDKCPNIAEDKDGFEDVDGCPDIDNDKDTIVDTLDKCPNVAEDKDGFEDGDGCPDYDNDKDAIADTIDKCPNVAEDKDGFEDSDGCPDLDNDKDGIPDSADMCKNAPEDFDGFKDGDGCPDVDSDSDGVADTVDKCPEAPEIYNFVNDSDGCPDTAVYFTPDQKSLLDTMLLNIRFDDAGKLSKRVRKTLDSIGVLLNSIASQHYLLCWRDGALTDSLCKFRADSIATLLAKRGIDSSRIAIPDSGCEKFCAECVSKQGGALYVKVIETPKEFLLIKKKVDTTAVKKVDTTAVKKVDTTAVKKVDTTAVKKVDTTAVKKVDTTAVKKVDTTAVKKVDTTAVKKVDTTAVKKVDTTAVKKVDTTAVKKVDTTAVKKVDTTAVKKVDTTAVKKVDTTAVKKVDTTVVKKVDTTAVKKVDTTAVKKVDTTAVKKVDTTAVKKVDTTAVKKVDTTAVKKVDTTAVKKVDTTAVKKVDTTAVKKVDTTAVKKK